jgi:predicted  nucleic acid-binding Zn-ribbon protein
MTKNNEANLIKYISEIKSANDRMERKIGEIEEDYIKRLSEKDKNLRES